MKLTNGHKVTDTIGDWQLEPTLWRVKRCSQETSKVLKHHNMNDLKYYNSHQNPSNFMTTYYNKNIPMWSTLNSAQLAIRRLYGEIHILLTKIRYMQANFISMSINEKK